MSKLFKNETDVEIYLANTLGHNVRIQPGESKLVHESMLEKCKYSPLTLVKDAPAAAKPAAKNTAKK
jgi:hypothetical protein